LLRLGVKGSQAFTYENAKFVSFYTAKLGESTLAISDSDFEGDGQPERNSDNYGCQVETI